MKISKKLQSEILLFMDSYWDSYIKGDFPKWVFFLPNSYKNIDNTKKTIGKNNKDIVNFTGEIAGQMADKFEIRGKQTNIFEMTPYIMVHEVGDVYQKRKDDWTFYSKFRMSSILQKNNSGWKIIHQHGLYPEQRTFGGEAFAYEKLKKQNLKLRKTVKRRTIELEDKNRELEIEAALERVRARAMDMRKSGELADTAKVLFEQINLLGKIPDRMSIGIINERTRKAELWLTDQEGNQLNNEYCFSLDEPTSISKLYTAWKENKDSIIVDLKGRKLENWLKYVIEDAKLPIDVSKIKGRRVHQAAFFSKGFLLCTTHEPFGDDTKQLLLRLARAFDHIYTRFLDLQKAEAQAREAQIEAALERVRAKAMAMHSSEDLASTVDVFFKELKNLEVTPRRCGVGLIDEETHIVSLTVTTATGSGEDLKMIGKLKLADHPVLDNVYNNWKLQKEYHPVLRGDEIKRYYEVMNPQIEYPDFTSDDTQYGHYFYFKEGGVFAWTDKELTEEYFIIFRRFTSALSLTYRRYLDLKEAEEQARETEIQLALERVRARTMAMHQSDELAETSTVIFEQFQLLGIVPQRCGFVIQKEDESLEIWGAIKNDSGYKSYKLGTIHSKAHPIFTLGMDEWRKGRPGFFYTLKGKALKDYHKVISISTNIPEDIARKIVDETEIEYHYNAFFKHGSITTIFHDSPSEEEQLIIRRFAAVLEQTYTRFLDLKKAEAQVKEAKIEASLERVRSKALAMNSSEDFVATISVFYHELSLMSHTPRRCGVGLIDKQTRLAELSTFNTTNEGNSIEVIGRIKLEGHPVLSAIFENWLNKREYQTVLRGNEIKEYYQLLRPQISIPDYSNDQIQYGYFFYFDEGGVYTWTEKELSENELQIYRKFTSVFSLAHRRYLDIKESEARAIEAVRQASLDHIRAEIASMRTAEDLNRITPIIWRELKTLEVPFIRCGVFIIDEEKANTRVYLTTPDGKSLGVLSLAIDANEITSSIVKNWRMKQVYKEHWSKEEFISWTKSMIELGQVQKAETYQGSSTPPDSLYMHFIPFTQGMLYVGDVSALSDEKLNLVRSLAEAFSIAYARYEDFNRVESAFKELDKLSGELKLKNEELENENQRKAVELEEARELQLAMLPKQIPEYPGLDIKVYMQTATEVGGDYYDFSYRDDGSINIAIGDATGHGMKAGTLVTMMKSLFVANSSNKDMEEFFNSSNAAIKNSNLIRMMAAFAMLNIRDHRAKFINAGMPPLYHYNKKEKEIKEIKNFNIPLGVMSIGNYKAIEVRLNKGDVLIMMSDGFPELRCNTDELFGYERVYSALANAAEMEPQEIINHLKEEGSNWANDREPDDDVTFVVIKIK